MLLNLLIINKTIMNYINLNKVLKRVIISNSSPLNKKSIHKKEWTKVKILNNKIKIK